MRPCPRVASADGVGTERERGHHHPRGTERGPLLDRAVGTAAFAGLVVPQYLVEKYQPLAVSRRAFLNTLVGTPSYGRLSSASVIIPKETVAPGMGAQSAENQAFSTASWASTSVTLSAVTIGG